MSIVLQGLDGSNPLAFLAALGVLRVLDDRARQDGRPRPRMSWTDEGRWRPVLHDPETVEEVIDAIMEDLPAWSDEPALSLAYTKAGERAAPGEKGAIQDLKPAPAVMHAFLEEIAAHSVDGGRRSVDTVAALATDVALDNNGNTKPTALHFTAGQQTFLKMVCQLRDGVSGTDFEEALAGPWRGESRLPSLSWDATTARMYALRATDPSKEKRGSVPGADWLAFLGLGFLPVFPVGRREPRTTGVEGGWKSSAFTWPVWEVPSTARTVHSLLAWKNIEGSATTEREARGVGVVFSSAILRADQGGYGSFSPARVV